MSVSYFNLKNYISGEVRVINVLSENYLMSENYDAMEVYLKLRSRFNDEQIFLLESLAGPVSDTQKSIIGFNPIFTIKIIKNIVELSGDNSICSYVRKHLNMLLDLKWLTENSFNLINLKEVWDILRKIESAFNIEYKGVKTNLGVGFFGYLGYDTIRYVEDLPYLIQDESNVPELMLSIYQGLYYIDLNNNISHVTINQFDVNPNISFLLNDIHDIMNNKIDTSILKENKVVKPDAVTDSISKEKYIDGVNKALEYIAIGEIYQVQLGHSITIKSDIDPFLVYLRKRELNPSPYMYFTKMNDITIIGASPELFIRVNDNIVTMRPIAGTIKRGENELEDNSYKEKLKSDPKECAEHIMLVDLCRNDIGRVCSTNTLEVTELMVTEQYSHVFHMVSNVIGKVESVFDKYDVFSATFPAGTMTGAPKIRAMEIIEELETSRRHIYAGSVGFIDFNGTVETALCIRSSFYKNGEYNIRASAGIVSDSIPENEWAETIIKLSASYKAITGMELKNESFIN